MSDTDTSDEAFQRYWWNRIYKGSGSMSLAKYAWQECRRRCEAQMEERERKAYKRGYHDGANHLEFEEIE